MNIREMQENAEKIINLIDDKINVRHNDSLTMRHLIEEMGELARQINKPDLRNEQIDKENLEEELADVILLLSRIANNNNIDLEQSVTNKIEKLKQRHNLN